MAAKNTSLPSIFGAQPPPHIPCNEEELKRAVEESLDNIQSNGSFAVFEQLESYPNPGIYLNHGGNIGLPLSDRDAQAIVAASHAAPFGKGEETIIDTNVRKTWEISSSDFKVRNPAWKTFLQSVVAKVSRGLGVDSTGEGVSAELYKMLLYDEGAMFKPHQDSEKTPRMFATLVIALPSKHTGGEVRVMHAGKTEVFETSKSSEFDCSCLAWFADVTHEVKPVLSGRRLVLTYNLIHTTLQVYELTSGASRGILKLKTLLTWWKDNLKRGASISKALAYVLEHQYTAASLGFDGLKGHDQQVVAHIRELCEKERIYLYLANMDVTIVGGCDEDASDGGCYHPIIQDTDRTVTLNRVVQLDGVEVANDLDLDESFFVQNEPFDDQKPDEEEYSGFTGNEGVSATHFYHRTVLLMIPKEASCLTQFFFFGPGRDEDNPYGYYATPEITYKPQVTSWIQRLTTTISGNPQDEDARDLLSQICIVLMQRMKASKDLPPTKPYWRRRPPPPPSDEEMFFVVSAILEVLDSKELILLAVDSCLDKATASLEPIGAALLRYDLESILPNLTAKLTKIPWLSDRLESINILQRGLRTEAEKLSLEGTPLVFDEWIKSEISRALSSAAVDSAQDGLLLSKLCKTVSSQEIFAKVLPVVKRNVNNPPMAIAFVTDIFNSGHDGSIPPDVARTIFRDVVADLADGFSFKLLERTLTQRARKRAAITAGYRWRAQRPALIDSEPVIDIENSRNIALLLCHCQELELRPELERIVSKLSDESRTVKLPVFENMFHPFLKTLTTLIIEKQINVEGSPFQTLFQHILTAYINRYVQSQPEPPKDWTRERVSCWCQDCVDLNKFLVDPRQKIGRFALAQQRRKHLQKEIESTHYGFKHEIDKNGSPQTLVVTKTTAQHQDILKAWKRRCVVASNHLESLGEPILKELLGDLYAPVMSLSVTSPLRLPVKDNASQIPPALRPSNSSSNRIPPPITKRKIPGEVIIIDDE